MRSGALVSLGEDFKSSYEPDAEYVDGVIEERPAGNYDHSSWQGALLCWFEKHKKDFGIRVLPSLHVQVAPTRYRVPDVVVFDRERPIEQILTHPPIAVFERLSPEDLVIRMLAKLADYEQMGIQAIFLIFPETDGIYRYQGGSVKVCTEETTRLPQGTQVDWKMVRGLLDM